MKSEFYIATKVLGATKIKKEKGLIATIKTAVGPLEIGFRYVHIGHDGDETHHIDEIICVGTELKTGVIIGKSNNIVNCAKEIRKNAKNPKMKLYLNAPLSKTLRDLIREEKEKVSNE